MRRVVLESPFAGNIWRRWLNRRCARRCLRDSCLRGEAPIASHLLYTQALHDDDPRERKIGIEAGLAWGTVADATVVYIDRGISHGMRLGIARAHAEGRPVEYRSIGRGAGRTSLDGGVTWCDVATVPLTLASLHDVMNVASGVAAPAAACTDAGGSGVSVCGNLWRVKYTTTGTFVATTLRVDLIADGLTAQ